MTAVLNAEQVDVGYDGGAVVSDINTSALRGQLICLLGPNGAGKSTILRTLSGHLAPLGGTVYIGGKSVTKMSENERAKKLSVVLTEKPPLHMTTARDLVSMGRSPHTGFWGRLSETDEKKVLEAMDTVGISELAERAFMGLSDGEKQKILIARALAQEPQLMILDEPTSHLDINSRIEIMNILSQLAHQKGLTIIMSIHDIDIALKTCQNVILIKDGRLLSQGTPEDTIGDRTIEGLYDIEKASYDTLLGNMELRNTAKPLLFIVAGAGSGIPLYRALTRNGFGFVTGILHEGDIDCRVAADMRIEVVREKPFTAVSGETFAAAEKRIGAFRCAVDTAFPLGEHNTANVRLLRAFLHNGGKLFSMRPREENLRLYPECSNVAEVTSAVEITDYIKKDYQTGRIHHEQ